MSPSGRRRDFGTGHVPRRHGDILDPGGAYLAPVRHTLLVAVVQPAERAPWAVLTPVAVLALPGAPPVTAADGVRRPRMRSLMVAPPPAGSASCPGRRAPRTSPCSSAGRPGPPWPCPSSTTCTAAAW
ncbi:MULTISPECIES: hypothetical protein [unclassified Streptomyces]|uniref:hypothetical protein n=1 Tax=unclassified Streptomyces TaxID=2593676 RepID=UPI003867EF9B